MVGRSSWWEGIVLVVFELAELVFSNSVSMALGIDGWWLSLSDAMALVICSTAIAIVVFS